MNPGGGPRLFLLPGGEGQDEGEPINTLFFCASVQLRVTSANDGGSAVPSEPVSAQVPVAQAE